MREKKHRLNLVSVSSNLLTSCTQKALFRCLSIKKNKMCDSVRNHD